MDVVNKITDGKCTERAIVWQALGTREALRQQDQYMEVENIHQALLRQACYERGIGVLRWIDHKGVARWAAKGCDRIIQFKNNMPSTTSQRMREIVADKDAAKAWLKRLGCAVPTGRVFNNTEFEHALDWWKSSSFKKVVVKPLSGSGGHGVFSDVATSADLKSAFSANAKLRPDSRLIVEQYVDGLDYRILMVAGRFHSAILRWPAHVLGDGVSTINDLVMAKNQVRLGNPYLKKCLLRFGENEKSTLGRSGLSENSVLQHGEKFVFHKVANVGRGGDSVNVTNSVHPDFIEFLNRLGSKFQDMQFCGLDLIAQDISSSLAGQEYTVIELNVNCDLALHHFPVSGGPEDAAGAVIDSLFPSSIPVTVVSKEFEIIGTGLNEAYLTWVKAAAVNRAVSGEARLKNRSILVSATGPEVGISSLLENCMLGPRGALPAVINLRNG